jgi:pheromone shutdown protein TraB
MYQMLVFCFQNTGSAITCVKVISTVDFMVAAGNDQGIVTVFQIPKTPPDGLPESMKPKKNKQVCHAVISFSFVAIFI